MPRREMVMLPKVACIMPTYGRISEDPDIISEAVYWFTRQDYMGGIQLLIVNDCPGQVLHCATPNVRVINTGYRFGNLGHKYNFMTATVGHNYDIILPWEDDDISLPWRVSDTVEALGREYLYWNPKVAYFQNGKDANLTLCSPHSVHHNASGYRRGICNFGVEYPADDTNGFRQDYHFDIIARRLVGDKISPIKPKRLGYVYRWCISSQFGNLSGYKKPEEAYQNRPIPTPGRYDIIPRIGRDYESEVASCNFPSS